WEPHMQAYSKLSLTYPKKDKLVAIGAITRKFEKLRGDHYLAGLFQGDLPQALLWEPASSIDYNKSKSKRIGGQTPSWSWAS
ncbi:uncharacterized protein K452DRAFT_197424, partial [Aplosporella prunicola CBS 121167]